MPNITRPRLFNFAPGIKRPESMIALALRHENTYYGALWVAYDKSHPFTEEESRFLSTLASQAALAAANARLFQTAEVGRQRLSRDSGVDAGSSPGHRPTRPADPG